MRLNVGDCVQLKTGGCLMTVGRIIDSATAKDVDCVWFNDTGELKTGRFAREVLRRWLLDERQDRYWETATEKPFDSSASS
jgi:uncharacterized protein YodC (DUF2158 family)